MIQETIFGTYELLGVEDGETVVLFEGTFAECVAFQCDNLTCEQQFLNEEVGDEMP